MSTCASGRRVLEARTRLKESVACDSLFAHSVEIAAVEIRSER
jgi:hypothetical protein